MRNQIVTAASIAFAAGILWLGWREISNAGTVSEVERVASAAPSAPNPATPATLALPAAATPVERVAADSAARNEVRAPSSDESPGRLVIRAIDASTSEALESIDIRAASATRFADVEDFMPDLENGIELTPGNYSLVVTAPGCEPVERANVTIESDRVTDLGALELTPGSGRIVADLIGVPSPDHEYAVELIGDGRHRCASCDRFVEASDAGEQAAHEFRLRGLGSPCETCGFDNLRSRLAFGSNSQVVFTNLASGSYALRLVDEHDRMIGDERNMMLGVRATASVAFDPSASRTLQIELLDTDGVSLAGIWSRRMDESEEQAGASASDERELAREPIQLAFSRDGRIVASTEIDPPMSSGEGMDSAHDFMLDGAVGRLGRADRAREASDDLRSAPLAQHFEPSMPESGLGPSGIAIVLGLTASRLELHASAGDFVADTVVPASPSSMRIRLRLRPSDATIASSPIAASSSPTPTYREPELGR